MNWLLHGRDEFLKGALTRENFNAWFVGVIGDEHDEQESCVEAEHCTEHNAPRDGSNDSIAGECSLQTTCVEWWVVGDQFDEPGEDEEEVDRKIVVAEAPSEHLPKGCFEVRVAKVAHDQCLPDVVDGDIVVLEDWCEIFGFEEAQPATPKVVVAGTSRFDREEHEHEEHHEQQHGVGMVFVAEDEADRCAAGDDRPVGWVVDADAPCCCTIHESTVDVDRCCNGWR